MSIENRECVVCFEEEDSDSNSFYCYFSDNCECNAIVHRECYNRWRTSGNNVNKCIVCRTQGNILGVNIRNNPQEQTNTNITPIVYNPLSQIQQVVVQNPLQNNRMEEINIINVNVNGVNNVNNENRDYQDLCICIKCLFGILFMILYSICYAICFLLYYFFYATVWCALITCAYTNQFSCEEDTCKIATKTVMVCCGIILCIGFIAALIVEANNGSYRYNADDWFASDDYYNDYYNDNWYYDNNWYSNDNWR